MKFFDNRLYIEFNEMVECGVSDNTLKAAKRTGANCWVFINDPKDARKVLVDYEELKPMYKKMVVERYGDPYNHIAREPILKMVVTDHLADTFYRRYRYNGDMMLPIEAVYKYSRAVGWLNMLRDLDRKQIKNDLGLGVVDFYEHVKGLMGIEMERGKMKGYAGLDVLPADFPSSYQRLITKVAGFAKTMEDEGREAAYRLLINPAFGNKHAAKIGKAMVSAPSYAEKATAGKGAGASAPSFAEKATAGKGAESVERRAGESKGITMLHVAGVMPTTEHYKPRVMPENVAIMVESGPQSANKGGGFDPELYERQMAVIRAVAAKYNNLDAAQVTEMANCLFEANGWKAVSVSTIRKIMKENMHLLMAGRQGKRAHKSKVAMQVNRKVTEIPLVYWTLDGWTVELSYRLQGSRGTEYKRLVAVIVLDAWQKYPIGYAIGERETPELIREANRNALLHVQELFGEVYRPVQVQSDNYQIKNLTPFYQAMAHLHTPAAVGNAKAKVIEPYFMYLNKQYCQKMPNWTGFNVNANKNNQVNTEMLNKVKNTFPDKNGVIRQIETIIDRERAAKVDAYKATWGDMPEERKYRMNVVEWIEVFGVAIGKTNRVTGEGLVKQIDGVKYVYDSFEREFRNHMHLDWQLLVAPDDLTKVLAVSPDGRMRFLLEQKRVLPMDVMSTTPEDRAYRARIDAYNNELEQEITDMYGSDADVMREVVSQTPFELNDDNELALKVMFTTNGQQKDAIQDAKGLDKVQRQIARQEHKTTENEINDWDSQRLKFLEQNIDLSDYAS